MRRLFLIAAVISSVAAAASAEEITSADQCDAAVAANPASAREAAAVWYRLGGGTAARLCEASALEAMGADTTAAQLLTGVAQNTNRAMPLDLRATVLEDAGRLWLRAGRPDLTLETLASANRLTAADPDAHVVQGTHGAFARAVLTGLDRAGIFARMPVPSATTARMASSVAS